MACKRGVHRDASGLVVTNLTDHDDIRRLTQDRTECSRKCHADAGIDWHLVDAVHLIFDGIFHRDQLPVGLVHVVQATVERGRFSRAGGARYKNNSVGQVDALLKLGLVV